MPLWFLTQFFPLWKLWWSSICPHCSKIFQWYALMWFYFYLLYWALNRPFILEIIMSYSYGDFSWIISLMISSCMLSFISISEDIFIIYYILDLLDWSFNFLSLFYLFLFRFCYIFWENSSPLFSNWHSYMFYFSIYFYGGKIYIT